MPINITELCAARWPTHACLNAGGRADPGRSGQTNFFEAGLGEQPRAMQVTDGEGFGCANNFEKMSDPKLIWCREASKSCTDKVRWEVGVG